MSATLHLLTASDRLKLYQDIISATFETGIHEIGTIIAVPKVDVVIADDPESAIVETGVGGSAPHAHLLYIYINPDFPNLRDSLDSEIRSTLAHELHHCARFASVGYGTTLLEAIVSEGLADHFDIEINKTDPKPWSMALSDSELMSLLESARPELSNSNYNHSKWFYGTDSIPRWAGYSLGFWIVKKYLELTNRKASELVAEPASSFTF